MHELSVAQALVDEVEALIDLNQANAAVRIRLRIGPLAGVVPELLASAFPLAAAGSRAERAELELVAAPIRVRCQTCGAETEAAINRLLCAVCGDWHTQLLSGDELLLESVQLDLDETPQPSLLTPHSQHV